MSRFILDYKSFRDKSYLSSKSSVVDLLVTEIDVSNQIIEAMNSFTQIKSFECNKFVETRIIANLDPSILSNLTNLKMEYVNYFETAFEAIADHCHNLKSIELIDLSTDSTSINNFIERILRNNAYIESIEMNDRYGLLETISSSCSTLRRINIRSTELTASILLNILTNAELELVTIVTRKSYFHYDRSTGLLSVDKNWIENFEQIFPYLKSKGIRSASISSTQTDAIVEALLAHCSESLTNLKTAVINFDTLRVILQYKNITSLSIATFSSTDTLLKVLLECNPVHLTNFSLRMEGLTVDTTIQIIELLINAKNISFYGVLEDALEIRRLMDYLKTLYYCYKNINFNFNAPAGYLSFNGYQLNGWFAILYATKEEKEEMNRILKQQDEEEYEMMNALDNH